MALFPSRVALAVALATVTFATALVPSFHAAAADPVLTVRAVIPLAARDGLTVDSGLPAPDASYCAPADPSGAPPNSVLGMLTIGGGAAPTGTVVQVFFDGKAGPAERTRAAGGYRVDYAAGGATCANRVGAAIAVKVNGQIFASTARVGDAAAIPFLRLDVAVP
ncbi:MAG: hypothetical protein IT304_00355 [Dehalococcoidia bacterium]|nr:hypothetical protein [Dehalococcoidia bacterium]